MELYDELIEKKKQGESTSWDALTKDQVRELYLTPVRPIVDKDLAELFDVTIGKIRYRRNKYGLSQRNISLLRALRDPNDEWGSTQNLITKQQLLAAEHFDKFVIGLTHYCFRNGPIEEMHADGKLWQQDMATLNRYMVNRLALVVALAKENRWTELGILLQFDMNCGADWDAPSVDFGELYDALQFLLPS